MTGISEWSSFWGRFGPDRAVFAFEGRTVTWGTLEERCGQVAAGLQAAGLQHGDRVGLLIANCPEHFDVVLGCARLGTIVVPLNPLLTVQELAEIAADAGLSALVTDPTFATTVDGLSAVVPAERTWFVGAPPTGRRAYAELLEHGSIAADDRVDMNDPLFLSYTSGTTGRAKGAVLTHGNVEGLAVSVIACDGLTPDDRAVVTVPLAFTGAGISFAMPILHAGASMLIRSALDPEALLDDIEHGGVTFIAVVPVVLERMAASPSFSTRDLSGLRVAKVGGAAVPESLLRLYQERGVDLVGAYGLTEGTGMNLQLPAHDALRKLGYAGLPPLGQQAAIVDEAGQPVPAGQPGELVLAGACVMQGYWNAPEATAETLRDGWLHTGDVAIVDDEGYFKIVDRQKDLIISGGINVYPAEIERELTGHPDVVEIAVIGVPDEQWGETPMACVVSRRPDLTLEELLSGSANSLAGFKRPRSLRLWDRPLPRGMSGKILKREMRAEVLATAPPAR